MNLLPVFLLLGLSSPVLGLVRVSYPPAQQLPAASTAPQLAYSHLVGEAADLLRRVASLPDAQANQLMRQQSPALLARARQVKPAYIRWLRTLSPAQLQAEEKRLAALPGVAYLNRGLDSKLAAKMEHNPALGQRCFELIEALADGV